MAALAPDMIVTLEVATVLNSLVIGFLASCSTERVLWRKVVARGGLSSVSCAISGVLALVSVAILRIWFGLESGLLRYVSSLGVPRVAPSLVSASRLTLFDLASARHARWSRFSRVPLSSSLVKSSGSVRLPCLLGLVAAIKCWGFRCQRVFSALIKVVIVSGSLLEIGEDISFSVSGGVEPSRERISASHLVSAHCGVSSIKSWSLANLTVTSNAGKALVLVMSSSFATATASAGKT
ncbi:hypothetical protein F2Q70_00042434 [Brassica cretica]|uniref:Uncharacterized protein n=1 Tax=Brassica cretica TaxID=69181 RepID=A0A8S9KKI0_BRACR|nr:hypothetical protein F2Q70_00042434 [Brassica cretica]